MEAAQILKAGYLDILFDGRNKEYGSYELRMHYNNRMAKAMIVTTVITGLVLLSVIFSSAFSNNNQGWIEPPDVNITQVDMMKQEPKLPQPKVEVLPQKLATDKFVTLVIKKDEVVNVDDIPPVNELAKVADVTNEGVREEVITNAKTVESNTVAQSAIVEEDPERIAARVDVQATTNYTLWRKHLETYLQKYIQSAVEEGMAPGSYTVQVRFLVEKDGSIADVHAVNDPGFGLAQGAEGVVKRGPKWTPGQQGGKAVRSYHTQPITFVISEQ